MYIKNRFDLEQIMSFFSFFFKLKYTVFVKVYWGLGNQLKQIDRVSNIAITYQMIHLMRVVQEYQIEILILQQNAILRSSVLHIHAVNTDETNALKRVRRSRKSSDEIEQGRNLLRQRDERGSRNITRYNTRYHTTNVHFVGRRLEIVFQVKRY